MCSDTETPTPFDLMIMKCVANRELNTYRAANDCLQARVEVLTIKEHLECIAATRRRPIASSPQNKAIPISTFARGGKRHGQYQRRKNLQNKFFLSLQHAVVTQQAGSTFSVEYPETTAELFMQHLQVKQNFSTAFESNYKRNLDLRRECFSFQTNNFIQLSDSSRTSSDSTVANDQETNLLKQITLPSVSCSEYVPGAGIETSNLMIETIFSHVMQESFPVTFKSATLKGCRTVLIKIMHGGMDGFADHVEKGEPLMQMASSVSESTDSMPSTAISSMYSLASSALSSSSSSTYAFEDFPPVFFGGNRSTPALLTISFVLKDYESSFAVDSAVSVVSIDLLIVVDSSYQMGFHQTFQVNKMSLKIGEDIVAQTALQTSTTFRKAISDLMPMFLKVVAPNDTWIFVHENDVSKLKPLATSRDSLDLAVAETQRLKIALGGKMCVYPTNGELGGKHNRSSSIEESIDIGVVVGISCIEDKFLASIINIAREKQVSEIVAPGQILISSMKELAREFTEDAGNLSVEDLCTFCNEDGKVKHNGVLLPLSTFYESELSYFVQCTNEEINALKATSTTSTVHYKKSNKKASDKHNGAS